MARYRKRPITIDAFRFGHDDPPEWFTSSNSVHSAWAPEGRVVAIQTLEGVLTVKPGDYVVRGVQGELYPVKADIFHSTYEEVKDGEA